MEDRLVEKLREWLGEEGVDYFREVKKMHGRIDAVFAVEYGEGKYFPYSVYFREGMQVRNFLRSCEETATWSHVDYEERWLGLVAKAIEEGA
jgi:hypothetical protein